MISITSPVTLRSYLFTVLECNPLEIFEHAFVLTDPVTLTFGSHVTLQCHHGYYFHGTDANVQDFVCTHGSEECQVNWNTVDCSRKLTY